MKRFLALFLTVLTIAAVMVSARPLALRIDASLMGEAFSYETTHTEPGGAYDYKLTDLRYYISKIAVTHDGGQQTELEGVYVLVDLSNAEQVYDLGDWDVNTVESIRMSIGVDEENNHKDPTKWPSTHPLSPKLPTMHWGWTAGYRFCTLEGYAGMKGFDPSTKFEVHSVGDNLYKTLNLDCGATDEDGTLTIQLLADYANLLTNIEANWGPISHGSTGESATLMENFTQNVFSAKVVASVSHGAAAQFSIAPNPVTDHLTISLDHAGVATAHLMDISGVVRGTLSIEGGYATFNTSTLPTGAYTLVVEDHRGVISSRMVSVIR